MNIIKWKIGDIPPPIEGQLAAAIGNFDGIHQGHVKLLNECKLQAKESKLAFGVVTFDPHPRDFFNPKNPSFKLLDYEEKQTLLSKLGVKFLIIIEFNEQLKNCNPNVLAKLLVFSILPSLFFPNLKFDPENIFTILKFCFRICDINCSELQFFNCSLNSIIIRNSTPCLFNNLSFSS